jgi:MtN3 and saliva related transmembrane protein
MDLLIVNAVGVAAALCSMSSFLPQVIKIVRERDASSVSLRMYLVTVTGFSLWTAYGTMLGSWPLIVSNLVSLGLSAAILVLKLRFDDKQKGPQSPAAPMQLKPEGSD